MASVTTQSPGLISAWVFFLFYFWPDVLTTGKILRVLWPKCLAKFRIGNTMISPVESARKSAFSKACWGSMQFIRASKHSENLLTTAVWGRVSLGQVSVRTVGHILLLEWPLHLSHQGVWLWPPPSEVFTTESTAILLHYASIKLPVLT